uniref:Uncharacterized protein n=1 Tax=Strix occidentalis caurina TaxID=311401 RepID=A0A8D0FL54_STROC
LSILHLLFSIVAGLVPQPDLENFIRKCQLQEGCSFPSVCRGLVLTCTSGIRFARGMFSWCQVNFFFCCPDFFFFFFF